MVCFSVAASDGDGARAVCTVRTDESSVLHHCQHCVVYASCGIDFFFTAALIPDLIISSFQNSELL